MEKKSDKIEILGELAVRAGDAILDIYNTDFSVDYKDDKSPLTEADCRSHRIIVDSLKKAWPDIPVVSEESGRQKDFAVRSGWRRFWLVDPLDGTKEFVKRNGEFTVNIALVEDRFPVLGVIYVPVSGALYYGARGMGAWRKAGPAEDAKRIRARNIAEGEPLTIVQSRSHPSEALEKYLEKLNVRDSISAGSSLKFCLVAEGRGDLYARLGPTMEWDTAAGQAIVEEAGGRVVDMEGNRLSYNKESLKNPHFIVRGG